MDIYIEIEMIVFRNETNHRSKRWYEKYLEASDRKTSPLQVRDRNEYRDVLSELIVYIALATP